MFGDVFISPLFLGAIIF